MNRQQLLPYISVVIDDSLNVQHRSAMIENARLCVWQTGFEPMVVAVQSYLGVRIDNEEEAADHAIDYLNEIGWFNGKQCDPDYII